MTFDPVQRLLAIGAGRGSVRLLGQAGVDYYLKHESDEPVLFVQFLVNEVRYSVQLYYYHFSSSIQKKLLALFLGWLDHCIAR